MPIICSPLHTPGLSVEHGGPAIAVLTPAPAHTQEAVTGRASAAIPCTFGVCVDATQSNKVILSDATLVTGADGCKLDSVDVKGGSSAPQSRTRTVSHWDYRSGAQTFFIPRRTAGSAAAAAAAEESFFVAFGGDSHTDGSVHNRMFVLRTGAVCVWHELQAPAPAVSGAVDASVGGAQLWPEARAHAGLVAVHGAATAAFTTEIAEVPKDSKGKPAAGKKDAKPPTAGGSAAQAQGARSRASSAGPAPPSSKPEEDDDAETARAPVPLLLYGGVDASDCLRDDLYVCLLDTANLPAISSRVGSLATDEMRPGASASRLAATSTAGLLFNPSGETLATTASTPNLPPAKRTMWHRPAIKADGPSPGPRAHCALTAMPSGSKVVLFGGIAGPRSTAIASPSAGSGVRRVTAAEATVQNDVWVLDCATWVWTSVLAVGVPPAPRARAFAAAATNDIALFNSAFATSRPSSRSMRDLLAQAQRCPVIDTMYADGPSMLPIYSQYEKRLAERRAGDPAKPAPADVPQGAVDIIFVFGGMCRASSSSSGRSSTTPSMWSPTLGTGSPVSPPVHHPTPFPARHGTESARMDSAPDATSAADNFTPTPGAPTARSDDRSGDIFDSCVYALVLDDALTALVAEDEAAAQAAAKGVEAAGGSPRPVGVGTKSIKAAAAAVVKPASLATVAKLAKGDAAAEAQKKPSAVWCVAPVTDGLTAVLDPMAPTMTGTAGEGHALLRCFGGCMSTFTRRLTETRASATASESLLSVIVLAPSMSETNMLRAQTRLLGDAGAERGMRNALAVGHAVSAGCVLEFCDTEYIHQRAADAAAAAAAHGSHTTLARVPSNDGLEIYRVELNDGSVYEGELLDNAPHGRGKLSRANGTVLSGSFAAGKLHGVGEAWFADGRVYKGSFVEGVCEGEGQCVWQSTSSPAASPSASLQSIFTVRGDDWAITSYEGTWHEALPHGLGCGHFSNGAQYTGAWHSGLPHGDGVLSWETPSQTLRASGPWREGVLHGQQCTIDLLHKGRRAVYTGNVDNGCCTGTAVLEDFDGSHYEGEFRAGKRNGQGSMRYADKSLYDGKFIGGVRQGKGTCVFANGQVFVGLWFKDAMDGAGVLRHPDGSETRGTWQSGHLASVAP